MKPDIFIVTAILAFLLLASSFLKYRSWQLFSLIVVSAAYGFLVSEIIYLNKSNFEEILFLAILGTGLFYQSWKFYSKYVA